MFVSRYEALKWHSPVPSVVLTNSCRLQVAGAAGPSGDGGGCATTTPAGAEPEASRSSCWPMRTGWLVMMTEFLAGRPGSRYAEGARYSAVGAAAAEPDVTCRGWGWGRGEQRAGDSNASDAVTATSSTARGMLREKKVSGCRTRSAERGQGERRHPHGQVGSARPGALERRAEPHAVAANSDIATEIAGWCFCRV